MNLRNLGKWLVPGIVVLMVSCSKYEKGPLLTFSSIQKRIIGTWEVDEWQNSNGTPYDPTEQERSLRMTYLEGGNGYLILRRTDTIADLTWEFRNDDQQLYMSIDFRGPGQTIESVATIQKLSNKKLWTYNSDLTYSHFIKVDP